MNLSERFDRLDLLVKEDRVIRFAWTKQSPEGEEMACLLAALSPEVGAARSADACPAEVMPAWLAHLTPWMDDEVSGEFWPEMVRRYAAVAHRWYVLTPAAWKRLEYVVKGLCVREAMRHTKNEKALEVCECVATLCERAARGGGGGGGGGGVAGGGRGGGDGGDWDGRPSHRPDPFFARKSLQRGGE